ncbi:MAG: single-stranded DNA-binding protein [Flavobacteriales bacterium]|nr:single-stranded DNA-binding protein [Flavobacteriales bacterium]
MKSLNKVTLIGHIGSDPELKELENCKIVQISIATSEYWKDKNGNKEKQTQWHNLVFWNKLAETVALYVKKGSRIYIEGKLKNRSFIDKNDTTRYVTEIQVNEMIMLDKKGNS